MMDNMDGYGVISCKLKRTVGMSTAIRVLEGVMGEESCEHTELLFNRRILLNEFELKGLKHSEAGENAVKTLIEKYPALAPLGRVTREQVGATLREYAVFSSYGAGYRSLGVDDSIARAVADGSDVRHSPSELVVIFNKLTFPTNSGEVKGITDSTDGFPFPIGNYAMLKWKGYGNDRGLYACFSIAKLNYFDMYLVAHKFLRGLGSIEEIRFNK
jgi:hypothetical protein